METTERARYIRKYFFLLKNLFKKMSAENLWTYLTFFKKFDLLAYRLDRSTTDEKKIKKSIILITPGSRS